MTFSKHLRELAQLAESSAEDCADDAAFAAYLIASSLQNGHKLLVIGNGGSAADAQHFAAEYVGRYMTERDALPAIGLSADMSIVTAVGNDYGFEFIFARQVEALGRAGDVLVVISTSGLSQNLVEAVKVARQKDLRVVAFTGRNANWWLANADAWVHVDSTHTAHIQEVQIAMLHAVCGMVEEILITKGAVE